MAAGAVAAFGLSSGGCFPAAGEGVDPPALNFYFPVGLAVSRGGNVLYAVNSDFDLQWNGGTIQSLDLHAMRRDAIAAIADPTNPNLPLAHPPDPNASCPNGPPVISPLYDAGVVPGEACAPPTNASYYMRDSVVIGAFATETQLSRFDNPDQPGYSRLFTPVRGDASLSWADVKDDTVPPSASDTKSTYAPFQIDCGTRDAHNRCDNLHRVGNNAGQMGDTRFLTMPGEPFGMAQSEDGQSIVVTHQNDTLTSLFSAFTPGNADAVTGKIDVPALQFVLNGVPLGGIGVAPIPHDPLAYPECFPDATTVACQAAMPRPAFLETSRAAAKVALIRYYSDIGTLPSSPYRPFITNEADYNLNVNASATDFARGVVVDPSPRIRCLATITVPPTDPSYGPAAEKCARVPARVFVASRGPASLIVGHVGGPTGDTGSYDADLVTFDSTVVLPSGPSALKLAPIVDAAGNFAMRVFIDCFDANQIIDYDPDNDQVEAVINVGPGPYAITFDPFDFNAAARGDPAPPPSVDADIGLRPYRFAYVASFTDSFMQMIDLDLSRPDKNTWATIVYTVGVPTPPKGS